MTPEARIMHPEDGHNDARSIYTYSSMGKKLYPLDPYYCLENITLYDIATALSRAFKFNGLSRRPYSMAEHSILVSSTVRRMNEDPEQARLGLLMATDVMAFGLRSALHFNTPSEMASERMRWIEAVWGLYASPIAVDSELLQAAKNVVLIAERAELITVGDDLDQLNVASSAMKPYVEQARRNIETFGLNIAGNITIARDSFIKRYANLSLQVVKANFKPIVDMAT